MLYDLQPQTEILHHKQHRRVRIFRKHVLTVAGSTTEKSHFCRKKEEINRWLTERAVPWWSNTIYPECKGQTCSKEVSWVQWAKKKYMCVYCHMSKKSRVGRSGLIFFLLLLSTKPEIVVPGSGIRCQLSSMRLGSGKNVLFLDSKERRNTVDINVIYLIPSDMPG
jgi:hypothetical protein